MYIKKIIVVILLMGAVGMGVFSWYIYQTAFVSNTSFENQEAHVFIPTDANVLDEMEPLVKKIESFEALAKQKLYFENIKAGHYIINKGMTNNDIVNVLRSRNVPINVKFNNQERIEDLAGHISRQIEADSISLLESFQDSDFLKQTGMNENTVLSLFVPNTYEFYWNSSARTFRDRMVKEYERFWTESRIGRAKSLGLSKEQVIALAAIVQKETAKVDERSRVAGVYLNRLKVGMLLQADPTVIYAIKKEKNDFDQIIKRVLYVDLEVDSPYNTYKYAGIPPGPIIIL